LIIVLGIGAAYVYQKQVDQREKTVVGVNRYQLEDEQQIP
jgi:methylmalonyl-CoA mutase N-terminal domain/subunit